jgi:hypothetical protein
VASLDGAVEFESFDRDGSNRGGRGAGVLLLCRHLSRVHWVRRSPTTLLQVAAALSGVLFFVGNDTQELWLWLTGSATYLWPVTLLFCTLALLLGDPPSPLAIGSACLMCIIIAGCNETITFLLVLFLVYGLIRKGHMGIRIDPRILLWLLTATLASFLVLTLAPGHEIRQESIGASFDATRTLAILIRSCAWTLRFYLLWGGRALSLLFAGSVGYAIGRAYLSRIDSETFSAWVKRGALPAAGIGFLLTVATILPSVAVNQDYAPLRVCLPIAIYLTGLAFVVGLGAGRRTSAVGEELALGRWSIAKAILISSVLLAMGVWPILYTLLPGYPVARKYAEGYDRRYQFLKRYSGTTGCGEIVLDPLPDSGLLRSAEITTHTLQWKNREVREGMNLPCGVRLKGDPGIVPERNLHAYRNFLREP